MKVPEFHSAGRWSEFEVGVRGSESSLNSLECRDLSPLWPEVRRGPSSMQESQESPS